jgi:two-component system KDP operon response regulator KdpE
MASSPRILLVDDDPNLLRFLADWLSRDGYEVSTAINGKECLDSLDALWPDLVVLDLMLPDMSGEDVARLIKRRADFPILVLSAVSGAESKADLIERYAEDYQTKPFDYRELNARIGRVLRRLNARIPAEQLVLGSDLTLELKHRRAIVAGELVTLWPIEVSILAALSRRLGETLSTNELLGLVWADAEAPESAYVWVSIRRLRKKIERDPDRPQHLLTDPAGGYRLVPVKPIPSGAE